MAGGQKEKHWSGAGGGRAEQSRKRSLILVLESRAVARKVGEDAFLAPPESAISGRTGGEATSRRSHPADPPKAKLDQLLITRQARPFPQELSEGRLSAY